MSYLHCRFQRSTHSGFTLAEVLIAVGVTALFGLAAFATNERLLVALKSQKESTAASMMLQERMESFRALAYSSIASNQSGGSQSPTTADIVQNPTTSEAALGKLKETVTVSGYLVAASPSPSPSSNPSQDYNQWIRDTTGNGQAQLQNQDSNLATQYNLLKVDILLNWTGVDGRSRSRDLSAIFGKGSTGP
jgi:Tfp pilus assembly protein PilE